MVILTQSISETQNETEAVNSQLQAMSETFERLLTQLAEQREQCSTKTEKKYLDQLRKDVKKQAALIVRLQGSVEDTMDIIAEFSQAPDNPTTSRAATTDVNDMLFQAVAEPLQDKPRLLRQSWHVDVRQRMQIWRKKPTAGRAPSDEGESPNGLVSSVQASSSTISGNSDLTSSTTQGQPVPFQEDTDSDSCKSSSETASLSTSTSSSPRISIQDWSILTLPEASSAPPPLPRKSSKRSSYTPRVPSPASISPFPPIPTTPPPSVPEPSDFSPISTASGKGRTISPLKPGEEV